MPYSSRILDILFLFSVSIIWVMIVYQLILTIFGNRYRRRTEKEWWKIDDFTRNLPPVSILIPARNEEVVIGKTLKKILSTDYPEENIEVIVVNDGSTDRTETILTQMASQDSRIHPVHLL